MNARAPKAPIANVEGSGVEVSVMLVVPDQVKEKFLVRTHCFDS